MPALLALLSAGTFGVADFLGGQSARHAHVVAVTALTNLGGGAVAVLVLAVIGGEWSTSAVLWGATSGLCGLAGLMLLYTGLAVGPNKLVSPTAAVVAAAVPVTVGVATGDRPGLLAALGLVLVVPAIWLLAGGELDVRGADREPLLLAIGAGLGFGTFFTLLAQAPDGSGGVPLLVARVASFSAVAVVVLVRRPAPPSPQWAGVALLGGSIDMVANGFFLWSTRDGDLAIVGALVSLFPATTVLLAIVFLHERLTRSQLGGLGLALLAAMMVS